MQQLPGMLVTGNNVRIGKSTGAASGLEGRVGALLDPTSSAVMSALLYATAPSACEALSSGIKFRPTDHD